jgi:isoleucyl-tRNA synthetase
MREKDRVVLLRELKASINGIVIPEGATGVILETALTEELIEEGFVRELISKTQTMRKEAGFEVMDHIRFALTGNERLCGIVARNRDEIASEVLADEIAETLAGYEKEWDINGEKALLSVQKLG